MITNKSNSRKKRNGSLTPPAYHIKKMLLTCLILVYTSDGTFCFEKNTKTYHSIYELEFINAVNNFRQNPKSYIDTLDDYIKNEYLDPKEAIIAKNELIPLLKKTNPLSILVPKEEIRLQMENHKGINNSLKHVSHDFKFSWLNPKNIDISENICNSSGNFYTACLINMLVDYNVPGRGHRLSIMDPENTGIAVKRIVFGNETDIFNCSIFWIQEYIH